MRTAALLLAAVILLWGANWPIMKIGVERLGPMTFAVMRMAMAAACMFGFAAATGRLHLPTRRDWPIVLSVGILQMAGFIGLTTVGLQYVDAGRSSILAYTTPLWVVPGALLFLGERLNGIKRAGVVVGLLGVLVMFNPAAFDWRDPDTLLGNGLLMLAALLWAAQILQIRGHRWDSPPLELAGWQFLVAGLLLAPLALTMEWGRPALWDGTLVAVMVYNGPIATAFCFVAVIALNRRLPAVTTSLGMLGVPVCGVIMSALILGEPIGATKIVGLTLIVGGLALVALGERRRVAASRSAS